MAPTAPAQPRSWISVLLSLCLRGLGRGLWYALWGIMLFALAAGIFHRTLLTVPGGPPLVALPILALVYTLLGFVCGATIGVTSAVMDHAHELVATLHKPLDRIAHHVQQRLAARSNPQEVEEARRVLSADLGTLARPFHARIREFGFGRIWEAVMEHKLLRALLGPGNVLYELMRQGQDPASSGKTVEQFLREKLEDLAADDIRSRLRLTQYLNYAVVALLLLGPPLVVYLTRLRAFSP
ncbi:MAG: hypothetical protein L0099_10770 [Acidobacteria bacterium]|nr:hypothetical protein [Acidobacteriota bacterium]